MPTCLQPKSLHWFLRIFLFLELGCLRDYVSTLGFPRDGTSRGTSRDKPGRDVPLSLCPGTNKFPCPVVPLSRDKKVLPVQLSLCPGTRAGAKIPGQTLLSRDVPGQNHFPILHINVFSEKEIRLFYVAKKKRI